MIATFLVYACVSIIVYFSLVQPWINGQTNIRIGADSDSYWTASGVGQGGGVTSGSLVSTTGNLLGPVLVIWIFRNGFAIMCFNLLLLYTAIKVASSIEGVNLSRFGLLILLNAELLPSLATVNKEIFALLASILTAKYLLSARRSKLLLLVALAVSLFARWEQALILMLFLLFSLPPFRSRPILTLGFLIAAITIGYPMLFSVLGIDPSIFDYILENANFIIKLNSIQMAYGFPIVLAPKILMFLAGRLAQPWIYWSGQFIQDGFEDAQQTIFQPLGCLATLIVFCLSVIKGKLHLQNPIAFLVAITLIVTAATPFIQSRYLYGVYVLLSLELARSPSQDGVILSHAN